MAAPAALLNANAAFATGTGEGGADTPPPPPPPAPAPAPAPTAPIASATTPIAPVLTTVTGVTTSVTGAIDGIKPLSDAQPLWGNIRTFWGDNTPYWGNIRTFWGDTSPYSGDLSVFWGNIRTFNDSATDTTLLPAWGNIRTFAGDIGAQWGNIRTFWGNIRTFQDAPQDYTQLSQMLNGVVTSSQATFGSAVQAQTGKSFADGFANPLLAKYGIDLSNPQSLTGLDAGAREHFFMDWWDGLMNFSGADHVDHWMKEVNWSPTLTQQVGMSGGNSIVGILDFTITGEATQNVIKYGGVSTVANGHGAAVASLIVDPMDGKGVMGLAPEASVIEYNPFDSTMTAGWADITTGVAMLTKNGATIVNMSLGVPGWTLNQGWNTVFQDKTVNPTAQKQVFVIAAGNDGITQTQNILWKASNPQFIVVGSVDPTGTISAFSNRPGTACLTDDKGNCPGDYLMNHFMVAPGELILVSDGQGGVTRMSGTSFAAPLVSGTVALIQDRWPWLATHPKDVVGIVLKSARDLGAPGVDPIYGRGELDVQAALSPLDWSKLTFKQSTNGKITDIKATQLQATTAATRATWEANSVYFSLFEDTGESYRDFEVPMSSKLANQTVSVAGAQEQFMSYLTSRFTTWLGSAATGPVAPTGPAPAPLGFTDLRGTTQQVTMVGDATASLSLRPHVNRIGFRPSQVPFDSALHVTSADRRFSLSVGSGGTAGNLGTQSGFGLASDYDVENGGANPFLGFASGGSFANVEMRIAPHLKISSGLTQRTLAADTTRLGIGAQQMWKGLAPYHAEAGNMMLTYDPSARFSASFGYTMLHEDHAALGMASADPGDLPHGSTTDALTIGADVAVAKGFRLAASGTMGRTRAGDPGESGIAIGRSGLVSSAFQVAASKDHLFDRHDHLRMTLAQPMHVERGSVQISTVQVIDRQTGELGVVTQEAGITGAERRMVAEMIYGRSLMGGAGEVSLFGRANLRHDTTGQFPAATGGMSFRLAF